ncbi:hypothetical protein SAMN05421820_101838 [Pedobacter steynii]|uniref:Uncharacterized protein n=1 Tax=Pedobacter steynii TaxID=430522 RepID=A0A1G9LBL6_9SPHI|nr:hypothetical protein [Pedobacter steynii]NQX38803.1 hypothetical protein [Pedobacter steynii]SDL59362.1 hypothetical protein SAMN05421820_101838 [Pedobacter steynii]
MQTIDLLPNQIINLLNYSYAIVKKLLEEQGEFFPIGIYVDTTGKIIDSLAFYGDDFPLSNVLIDQMQNDFTKRLASGSIAAYSIVYDAIVRNEQYKDPIDVAIAKFVSNSPHSKGDCFMPYQIIDGKVKFLEPWLE